MSRTPLFLNFTGDSSRNRQMSWLLASSSRRKERRWPLVLRFWKGSVHSEVIWPIAIFSAISAIVVYLNQHISSDVTLPASIVPSLSIVVGLELVFRNQTAYARFWSGRSHFATLTTSIRCLTRHILVLVPAPAPPDHQYDSSFTQNEGSTDSSAYKDFDGGVDGAQQPISKALEAKTIETVKIMIAMLYTVKNHLRADWGVELSSGTIMTEEGDFYWPVEYKDLLPQGFKGHEHMGLGLTLQLSTYIEKFVNTGCSLNWFNNSSSAQMLAKLNEFVSAYGNMEVIRLAPTPVAHLIHSVQVLALFVSILPFAMAAEIGWWTVPLVAFVAFALYGIEGIARWHEDPFGTDKIDINMDDLVEDARREIEVMLEAWKTQGLSGNGIFTPKLSTPFTPRAEYGTLG
ncbi:hypothetical protein BCIN_03g05540 [Botrytis cinerea B05.10]|uniref:Uncharacterized protein n=3 Tax=Botryotinia fuckeliana TaxID=40559 RepID=A0A384JCE9_BOTFB|nr:hypothetical protein BCIN_03g05540 [Botrytis cinerea B05.10]ATZ48328.1 hypothetical protein BCIN_03g05540 [Botrytis cinerea B05.10]EMR84318.1 putative upf0187 domain protein [Botrytis cinerea BcDW1]CCD51556.1 hypothetical protein BofuT4_P018620.1 [Botrytis cinerea T4]